MPQLDGHDSGDGGSLRDLGVNSVDRCEIVRMTLESLHVQIPPIELAKAVNTGQRTPSKEMTAQQQTDLADCPRE